MKGLGYYIRTFLSKPDEVATVLLVVALFGLAGARYGDRRDIVAVATGILALTGVLGILGPPIAGEWHYWLGGGVLFSGMIVVVDERRSRSKGR